MTRTPPGVVLDEAAAGPTSWRTTWPATASGERGEDGTEFDKGHVQGSGFSAGP